MNINRLEFLEMFRHASEKADAENNIKNVFQLTVIWPINAGRLRKLSVTQEVVFISLVLVFHPPDTRQD